MTENVEPTAPMPIDPEQMLASDPRLAAFADALRGGARPAEMAAESALLDLMVTAIASNPAVTKDRPTMKNRFARVAAIATIGVLSAGGVAAAATGTNPLGPIVRGGDGPHLALETSATTSSTSSTTSTTSTTSSTTSTTSTTSTPPTTSTTSTTSTTTTVAPATTQPSACTENHGAIVSSVATDHSDDGAENHGAAVSAVAKTDDNCDQPEAEQPETEQPEVDQQGEHESDDDKAAAPATTGKTDQPGSAGSSNEKSGKNGD